MSGVTIVRSDGRLKTLADGDIRIEVGSRLWFGSAAYLEVLDGGLRLVAPDLPTVDPMDAGQIWLDPISKTIKISAGSLL